MTASKDGNLGAGKFYDLLQFRSGKGQKPVDGHIADRRVMEGGHHPKNILSKRTAS